MANYSVLKAAVQAVVKTNGNQEITGANMQSTLISIINSLGTGYQFMGVATPSTNPGTPDQREFYITGEAGTYTNFNSLVVTGIAVLYYDTAWHVTNVAGIDDAPTAGSNNLVKSGGVYSELDQLDNKLIKLVAMVGARPSDIQDGEYYYNTSQAVIYKIVNGASTVIPYEDGAIYTYNNDIFVWNGTCLEYASLKFNDLILEQGGINASGVETVSDTRVRTVGYCSENKKIIVPKGYQVFCIVYYNANTYAFDSVSYDVSSVGKANCVYRLVFAKLDISQTIIPTDLKGVFSLEYLYETKADTSLIKGYIDCEVKQIGIYTDNVTAGTALPAKTANSRYTCDVIPCVKGQSYYIAGQGGTNGLLWLFCDSDLKVTTNRSSAGYGTSTPVKITAQEDGYLVVNFVKSQQRYLKAEQIIKTEDLHKDINSRQKKVLDMPLVPYKSDYKFSNVSSDAQTTDAIYALYDALVAGYPDYITKIDLGTDIQGVHLYRYDFIPENPFGADNDYKGNLDGQYLKAIMLSGCHPEYMSIQALYRMMESICTRWETDDALEALRWNVHFIVIPCFCPHAINSRTKVNANYVNMARNFPDGWEQGTYSTTDPNSNYGGSEPLSELEAQYVHQVLMDNKDAFMCVDFHNHNSAVHTFWLSCRSYDERGLAVGDAYIRQTNRFARAKFDYIPSSYLVGYTDQNCPGGSIGYEASFLDMLGYTWETSSLNISGYTNASDIVTLSHDAMINFTIICANAYSGVRNR